MYTTTVRRIIPLSNSTNSSSSGSHTNLSYSYGPATAPASLLSSAFDFPSIPKVHKVTSKLPANYERTDKVSFSLNNTHIRFPNADLIAN